MAAYHREKFGRQKIVLLEKTPIAATAVHQGGGEFSAEFRPRLGQEARQPGDTLNRVRLRGQLSGIEDHRGRPAELDV
jgi:hypothetical protein